ncbi:MAG: flexitail domain-containing putative surface protein [Dehalococcoidia bacterium]
MAATALALSLGGGSVRAGPGATDTDLDGCTDAQELGSDALAGGRRNPNSFWDFFDTPDGANVRDRAVAVADIFRVSQRLGTNGSATSVANARSAPPATGYHAAFDRSAPAAGADLWDSGPADGAISTGDIAFAVAQFGHTCSAGTPPPNPTATRTPTPQGPTPTPLPPGSTWTITFNDALGSNRQLFDVYPNQVIDWGSDGTWFLSGPFGFPNKNVGFSGPEVPGGSFTFLTPRKLVSLDAYNGGDPTVLTLECNGNSGTARNVAVQSDEMITITTGWNTACSTVSIASTNGWDTNFDNLVVDGPLPPPTPTPPPPPTPPPDPTVWTFLDTFTGTPPAPQPFDSDRFDVTISSLNANPAMDGQTIGPGGTITYPPIEAGHGSDCGAPPALHMVDVNWDFQGFQQETRPQLAFNCKDHMMTTNKSGYATVTMMPRQLFDFEGRMGTVAFDTNVYTFGRSWLEFFIVPEEDMLIDIGPNEELPKRGVMFSNHDGVIRVSLIENYAKIYTFTGGNYRGTFPDDPALTDPKVRRTFKFNLSQTAWRFDIQKADGTFWSHSDVFPQPLSFTRGMVKLEHDTYNPSKDGIDPQFFTYHWDNVRFDGPVVAARSAYEFPLLMVDRMYQPVNSVSQPYQVFVGSNNQPRLIGHVYSWVTKDDPTNSTGWMQVRVNGGAWQNLHLAKDNNIGIANRNWSTVNTPITGVVVGTNTFEFRHASSNGFRLTDIEIQTEDRVVVSAGPTNSGPLAAFALASTASCDVPGSAPSPVTAVADARIEEPSVVAGGLFTRR